jgi:Flp pilus assembly protein TadG
MFIVIPFSIEIQNTAEDKALLQDVLEAMSLAGAITT